MKRSEKFRVSSWKSEVRTLKISVTEHARLFGVSRKAAKTQRLRLGFGIWNLEFGIFPKAFGIGIWNLVFVFFLSSSSLSAQSYQLTLGGGDILSIHPQFPKTENPSGYIELGMQSKLKARLGGDFFPKLQSGWRLAFYQMGNEEILGKAFGVTPFLMFPITGSGSKPMLNFTIASGWAWLTRPNHILRNPTNNVIGSHLNSLVSLRLELEGGFKGNNTLAYAAGFGYEHFSNSNRAVPNLGINIPHFFLKLKAQKSGAKPVSLQSKVVSLKETAPKWGSIRPAIRLGLGQSEFKTPGGPTYSTWLLAAYLQRVYKGAFRPRLGVEVFYSGTSYHWITNNGVETQNPKWTSTAAIVFVGSEMMLGRLSLLAEIGPYVKHAELMHHLLYTKLGMQWYFKNQQQSPDNQPFIGISTHSHSGESDFLEFGIGWVF